MWAASSSGLRRAVRIAAFATGGVGAVSLAQAFALHARYQALPDARGPREGVAVPSSVANAVAEWSTPPLAREAREFFEREVRPRLDALEEVVETTKNMKKGMTGTAAASDAANKISTGGTSAANQSSSASLNDDTAAAAAAGATNGDVRATAMKCRKQKQEEKNATTAAALAAARRVIIVGDSLVTGVGCSSEHDGGPMLPRRIGERLADLLGVRVEWVALGLKGADLKTIRAEVLPALRARLAADAGVSGAGAREVEGSSSGRIDSRGGGVDVVVLMCGVNDLKHALAGRTASAFHRDLCEVVDEIRAVTGDKCWVILPGLPMDCATIFPPPLSYLAVYGSGVWWGVPVSVECS